MLIWSSGCLVYLLTLPLLSVSALLLALLHPPVYLFVCLVDTHFLSLPLLLVNVDRFLSLHC